MHADTNMKIPTGTTANEQRVLLKNLEALIKEMHRATGPSSLRFGFCSLFRSNEFGEFGLDDRQAEVYLSILDGLAPDYGLPPPRSRAEIDKAIARCILSAVAPEDKSKNSFEERIEQSITELKRALRSKPREWEIWRFVERITIPAAGFHFGKALFCAHSHESAKCVSGRIEQGDRKKSEAKAKLGSW